MKCEICGKEYSPECDYRQGRCPHHAPMLDKPYPTWLLMLAAPFIIGTWCLLNPRKVWEQAKKDYEL